jgi:hypothetical protein
MRKIARNRVLMGAAAGLAGLLLLNSVLAAPPSIRQTQLPARQLDLSAPEHVIEASSKAAAFSSLSHQQTVASPEQGRFANLASGSMHSQPNLQDRVLLFRRDGLPVARLWENKSTLLHLGLNQKGKPGLWLMQKMH